VTYEHFAKAWPTMTDEAGFADRMNDLPKHVASSTLAEPLAWNASRLGADLPAAVAALKEEDGRDILVFGSAELVHALRRHGLIDELRLMVFPVVLGSGKRLFRDIGISTGLQLIESRTLGSGVVVLTYTVDGGAA
jgi:dihydrofolate reductase